MGGCWNGGMMRGRHVDGMRAKGLDDRAGDGYGATRWWREQGLAHQCVCMRAHVLPVALQSDFTPSFHPREVRAGVWALGSAPALPGTGCVTCASVLPSQHQLTHWLSRVITVSG